MEDNLNFSENGRRHQFQEMEDDVKFSENGRPPQFNISELFLLANVESKFPIKNNLQFNQSQPSLT
jgi:hypothetical protein